MKNDVFKIMILHKDKMVKRTIKREILKILPFTLFLTASSKNSFLEKIGWMTPDLVFSDIAKMDSPGLEALVYVRKYMAKTPFMFIVSQSQTYNDSILLILKEGDGTIDYNKPEQIIQAIHKVLPRIKKYKDLKSDEAFQLHQQSMLVQKSIALATKGSLIPQREIYLRSLANS